MQIQTLLATIARVSRAASLLCRSWCAAGRTVNTELPCREQVRTANPAARTTAVRVRSPLQLRSGEGTAGQPPMPTLIRADSAVNHPSADSPRRRDSASATLASAPDRLCW